MKLKMDGTSSGEGTFSSLPSIHSRPPFDKFTRRRPLRFGRCRQPLILNIKRVVVWKEGTEIGKGRMGWMVWELTNFLLMCLLL